MDKHVKILCVLNKQLALGIGFKHWCYFYIDILCFTISLNRKAGSRWFGFLNNWNDDGNFIPF